MAKRLWLSAALAIVLTSAGCTRSWCEHHGYYPVQPYQQPGCCVPCCPPCAPAATGYAAPAPAWNQPACTCAPAPH